MNLRVVILFPFSVLYGLILRVRHSLYDRGWIHSEAGALPTLVVGNLATGGSGKTPFTEWLCAHLAGRSNIAVLSRGYGRNTKGFYWVKPSDTAYERGDEPVQISRKFPSIPVAVCEDRIKGIRQIASIHPNLNLVILDDAYQHRKLRGDINVLLTEFQRPFCDDYLLPSGNLRDLTSRRKAASLVIVTKCPADLPDHAYDTFRNKLGLQPQQRLYFSQLEYLKPLQQAGQPVSLQPGDAIVAFSGIASPGTFRNHLESAYGLKKFKSFADHHPFSPQELQTMVDDCVNFAGPSGKLVCTEKDAVRLGHILEQVQWKVPLFFIPVGTAFLHGKDPLSDLLGQSAGDRKA